jgi:hypothetical protein
LAFNFGFAFNDYNKPIYRKKKTDQFFYCLYLVYGSVFASAQEQHLPKPAKNSVSEAVKMMTLEKIPSVKAQETFIVRP